MILIFIAVLWYRFYKIHSLLPWQTPNISADEIHRMRRNNLISLYLSLAAFAAWLVMLALVNTHFQGLSRAVMNLPGVILLIASAVFNHRAESARKMGL